MKAAFSILTACLTMASSQAIGGNAVEKANSLNITIMKITTVWSIPALHMDARKTARPYT